MNVETTTSTARNEGALGAARMNVETTESAASRAAPNDLAPPFYSPWAWNKSYPRPGFWSAYRHFDDRGELVLQLGRNGGQGKAKATNSYARWEPYEGTTIYVARLEPISLSRRPNSSNNVNLRAFLQINWGKPRVRELYGGAQHMMIRATGRHLFRVGFEVELQGNGTYGEVIAKIADVNQEPFDISRSMTQSLDAEPSLEEMQQELERVDGGKVQVVKLGSFKDVMTAGAEVHEA